ncbi:peptidylprolyl isomerase fpr3 [Lithohypha guttulata]|uniref:peptidylprolyl isomerase fpr3 n=1 Tax=Lithohypha guttulata TaxID=1690604 RepID=UPI002DE09045|nr:peptidylprolyl isomerase fpr3 [Lithohypha guttulata]
MVPAVPEFAAMFRLTMAAIDPSEQPELEAADDKQKPRATLKVVRVAEDMFDDDEDEDDYEDMDEDDEDDSEEEGVNGGPSSKKPKSKAALLAGDDDEDMEDEDEEDEEDAKDLLARIMNVDKKGKSKALNGLNDDDDDEDDDSVEGLGLDEVVMCTLDPEKQYQQTLDFVVAEGEKVFFKVSGSLTVHLTGNYIMPLDEPSDDEDDEYDLSPDEDEEDLDGLDALVNGDDESDELDDIKDPKITELDSEEEADLKSKITAPPATKGKNKRPAAGDAEEDVSLDTIMAKSLGKPDDTAAPTEAKKLSKAEKKKAKKLKNNDGEAATPPQDTTKEAVQASGADSGKKVQFAKNLEQGPTPSKNDPAKPDTKTDSKKSSSLGVKDVQGVSVDERKVGTGPQAKKGSKLEMRYIGKLDDGKVFDSNKSGKPFSFKLGAGEVIKGWDLGLAGIASGGERRLIIPAHLAYGKKALPGIPANSKLTFDIKCIRVS